MSDVYSEMGNHQTMPHRNAEAIGAEDATDAESIIQEGGRAVEAMGDDLEAASRGAAREIDIDSARQRLRDCQSALAGLGYDVSHGEAKDGIDGVDSRDLKDAVTQFQDDNDLELTGRIDRDTYEAILRTFDAAMSVQSPRTVDDDFSFLQASHPLGAGAERGSEQTSEALDDSEQALIDIQDDIDAGVGPAELEDL